MIQPESRGERWVLYLARQARGHQRGEAIFCINAAAFVALVVLLWQAWPLLVAAMSLLTAYDQFERRQFANLLERQERRIAQMGGDQSPGRSPMREAPAGE
jgi:hypothetical protein